MSDSSTDEVVLEREVRDTQDEIGETVQKLEEKLEPRNVARAALGANVDIAKEAIDVVRHSPIPAALIAVGAIWLLATSRSPTIKGMRDRLIGGVTGTR